MIVVIDYGCGNVNAFVNAFKRLNIEIMVAKTKEDIVKATKIILPGVGAFDHVMSSFNSSGFREVVEKRVLEDKAPVLGVCAGMQILANGSDEGNEKGLGWIQGFVRMFDVASIKHKPKLPHMGWNDIITENNTLFKDIDSGSRFYFVHSYYFEAEDDAHVIAKAKYGNEFASSVNKDNIYGVQFHPEKSHENGQKLLYNFAKL